MWRVLYRGVAAGIILFWLVMTGLLVRLELFPGRSGLLPVPVDHVFKLMFLHEQVSDLVILRDQARLGDIQLQPHRFQPAAAAGPAGADSERNLLVVTAALLLQFPGVPDQHVTLRGKLSLNDQDAVQRFDFTASLHDPKQKSSTCVIVLDGEPPRGRYHYKVTQEITHETAGKTTREEKFVAEQTGTPSELLDQPELRNLGINPAVLSSAAQQQSLTTQVAAYRGVLPTKGEDIETYDVTIRQADTLAATVQLSQLGQILAVQTFAGYSLLDESLVP